MLRTKKIASALPRLLLLVLFLTLTLSLDGLAYGFANSCAACTTFGQFLVTPSALSAPVLASISSLLALTKSLK